MILSQLSYLTDKDDRDMVRVWQLFWSSFHIWPPIILTVHSGRYGAHLEAHFSMILLIVGSHRVHTGFESSLVRG